MSRFHLNIILSMRMRRQTSLFGIIHINSDSMANKEKVLPALCQARIDSRISLVPARGQHVISLNSRKLPSAGRNHVLGLSPLNDKM